LNFDVSLVRQELAPTGVLRAGINRGNGTMVKTDASGAVSGVSVDLARAAADRLGLPIELTVYDTAGKVFDAFTRGACDVVFLAIDPARAAEIDFTEPYVVIEGVYAVFDSSPIKSLDAVDQAGHRISVIQGSAYDLFLSRNIKNATVVRSPTGEAAMSQFVDEKLEAMAGVRQAVVGLMEGRQGLRLLEPPFMQIRQAMGTPKGRPAGAAFLKGLVEDLKTSGEIAASLRRSNLHEVTVPPPIAVN
jgi:polar amino acid transport system substrate-binding protein